MAVYTTVDDAGLFFNTITYAGTSGASQAQTGVGFQPDLVWIKAEDAESHVWTDSARGATESIASNTTAAEVTMATGLLSFDSDGFTVGSEGKVGSSSYTYVAWSWKGGTTSGLSGGTLTPSAYSFNTTSGFSILAYTGTGSTETVPHGLGAVPACIIVKNLGATAEWQSYQQGIPTPEDYTLQLSATGAKFDTATRWDDTAPTSSVFTLAGNDTVNGSSVAYIAYVFAQIKGYSKFSSYEGNGNADGTFVYTGFKPACVITKKFNSTGNWNINDNRRAGYNPDNEELYPNLSGAPGTSDYMDLLSNGFKLRSTNTDINASGDSYIYMAWAENPLVNSSGVPGTTR